MACNARVPSQRLSWQCEEPAPTSALGWLSVLTGGQRRAVPARSPCGASDPGTALLALIGDFQGAATLLLEPGAGGQA